MSALLDPLCQHLALTPEQAGRVVARAGEGAAVAEVLAEVLADGPESEHARDRRISAAFAPAGTVVRLALPPRTTCLLPSDSGEVVGLGTVACASAAAMRCVTSLLSATGSAASFDCASSAVGADDAGRRRSLLGLLRPARLPFARGNQQQR